MVTVIFIRHAIVIWARMILLVSSLIIHINRLNFSQYARRDLQAGWICSYYLIFCLMMKSLNL